MAPATRADIEDYSSCGSTTSSDEGAPESAAAKTIGFTPAARCASTSNKEPTSKSCGGGCSCAPKGATAPQQLMSQAAATVLNPIYTSTFELFKVGIGPSSSHTVGPLVACRSFAKALVVEGLLDRVARVRVELCGSLALTGIGHYTHKAVVLGLTGVSPAKVDTTQIEPFLQKVEASGRLTIGFDGDETCERSGHREIDFVETRDVLLFAEELPLHPNGMICQALDQDGEVVREGTYYSIGGGFVNTAEELLGDAPEQKPRDFPFPFTSMCDLVRICQEQGMSLSDVMRKNEEGLRTPEEVEANLTEIWRVMEACVDRGLAKDKIGHELPGPLGIMRRAPELYAHAKGEDSEGLVFGLMDEMRWLSVYALAVMEENACMGQVVTAPTNGAAGVVPAVLTYYMRHLREKQPAHKRTPPSTFLLAAAAAGILAKERASISGAVGGCQAEVGTASAMAAAGLCAALGGSPQQVDEAAEIALEHSLGMTCDPVLGLVQVPCIERNTMGATKALNAVSLVLRSPTTNRRAMMRYDDVLRVMKETGKDMSSRYRETAQGGLAADYEASLPPAKWEEVKAIMGIKRIQVGPRRTPRKAISYEEVIDLVRSVPPLDLCKC